MGIINSRSTLYILFRLINLPSWSLIKKARRHSCVGGEEAIKTFAKEFTSLPALLCAHRASCKFIASAVLSDEKDRKKIYVVTFESEFEFVKKKIIWKLYNSHNGQLHNEAVAVGTIHFTPHGTFAKVWQRCTDVRQHLTAQEKSDLKLSQNSSRDLAC